MTARQVRDQQMDQTRVLFPELKMASFLVWVKPYLFHLEKYILIAN